MMQMHAAELRRRLRQQADIAQAVSMGYASCKSKDAGRALEQFMRAVRGN